MTLEQEFEKMQKKIWAIEHMRNKEEAKLQEACVKWARMQYRDLLIWHCPNGGSRNTIEGANLKRQGVLAGVCDLHVDRAAQGYHGLKIEMKARGGKLTPEQKAYKEQCEKEDYLFAVVDNVDDFIKLLKIYLG